jgi:hypothetical protein
MKRILVPVAAIVTAAMAAVAQQSPLTPHACELNYKAFVERMSEASSKLSGRELADIHRVAVRGFDACTSGDQKFDAKGFFEKLGPARGKPEDIFKEFDRGDAGAKK